MPQTFVQPIEGALYRTYEIDGHVFPIYYGYYDEDERGRVEPLPVFPDLKENDYYSNKMCSLGDASTVIYFSKFAVGWGL